MCVCLCVCVCVCGCVCVGSTEIAERAQWNTLFFFNGLVRIGLCIHVTERAVYISFHKRLNGKYVYIYIYLSNLCIYFHLYSVYMP